ncbi:transglycosylase SLT domain-containing protein [Metabacillus sp. GX 13764]|uniref:transglycosylase SLT domain-containing protein n=1 Tax=Metabacillus kandeliae TaxID=2900151 RepID=UPI001E33F727|nr:transglycosylase SLT domain-containing protein [Metabacillus kandeliae]MCD7034483.1 transglycosylase SLT domain-containing protein [Metabacillus kandeliae]
MKKLISTMLAASIVLVPMAGKANAVTNELNMTAKKELLTETALKYQIPPEILKAIALRESNFTQFNGDGSPYMNPVDKGIGIMQVTPSTFSESEKQSLQMNEDRLKTDTQYNIEMGAKILKLKWDLGGTKLPKVNSGNPLYLESWYYALMGYNGVSASNNPTVPQTNPYQSQIYQLLKNSQIKTQGIPTDPSKFGFDDQGRLTGTALQWDYAYTPSMNTSHSGKVIFTNQDGANLRATPDGTVVGRIAGNEKIEILDDHPVESASLYNLFSYYKVKADGKTGYMSSSNFKLLRFPLPNPENLSGQKEAYARLVIKADTPIVKKENGVYKTLRMAKTGEGLRVYTIDGEYYGLGANLFVKQNRNAADLVVGLLRVNNQFIYLKDITDKTYVAMDNKVYAKHAGKDELILGKAVVMKDIAIYNASGKVFRTGKTKERLRVYKILPDRYEIGGGYYVKKQNVDYYPVF